MASNLTGAAATTSTYTLPSSIKTTNQAKKEEEQKVLNGDGGAMGQTAFLTLFTTQLQNQNPLDPMENEAFVAQLAQFSQLEATTKMSDNLQNLVASMSNERMSSMSGLLGKKIAISDGKALLSGAQPVEGAVTLANDVDSITLKVFSCSAGMARMTRATSSAMVCTAWRPARHASANPARRLCRPWPWSSRSPPTLRLAICKSSWKTARRSA
jgi:hypothetical protein